MSFSRRLSIALQDNRTITIKHNQILVEHVIYQRLLDISNGDIIILRVTIDNDNVPIEVKSKEFFVSVVGEHPHRADVLVSQELINFFDQPIERTRFRFTFIKKLPELSAINIKFLENDFCFIDPREAVQAYLEDYHIIYEGMLIQIPSQVESMVGLIRIESLKPASVCRVPNGEVELEIVTDESPLFATATPLHLPSTQPPPIPPIIANNIIYKEDSLKNSDSQKENFLDKYAQNDHAPFNFQEMKRTLFPDLITPNFPIEAQSTTSPTITKEELRAARLAFYSKKNN
jgi:hypothetical protein